MISNVWTNASQICEAVLQYLEGGHIQLIDSCRGSLIGYKATASFIQQLKLESSRIRLVQGFKICTQPTNISGVLSWLVDHRI